MPSKETIASTGSPVDAVVDAAVADAAMADAAVVYAAVVDADDYKVSDNGPHWPR